MAANMMRLASRDCKREVMHFSIKMTKVLCPRPPVSPAAPPRPVDMTPSDVA